MMVDQMDSMKINSKTNQDVNVPVKHKKEKVFVEYIDLFFLLLTET